MLVDKLDQSASSDIANNDEIRSYLSKTAIKTTQRRSLQSVGGHDSTGKRHDIPDCGNSDLTVSVFIPPTFFFIR